MWLLLDQNVKRPLEKLEKNTRPFHPSVFSCGGGDGTRKKFTLVHLRDLLLIFIPSILDKACSSPSQLVQLVHEVWVISACVPSPPCPRLSLLPSWHWLLLSAEFPGWWGKLPTAKLSGCLTARCGWLPSRCWLRKGEPSCPAAWLLAAGGSFSSLLFSPILISSIRSATHSLEVSFTFWSSKAPQ